MTMNHPLHELEQHLSYTFSDKTLLETALRHSSYAHEQPGEMENNERLEFLGDAVLNLIVSHLLMERFPALNEGDLSRLRASLVNEDRLASVAKTLALGEFIKLGKGEMQSFGRKKKSILADTLEAIFAAIYLDSSFNRVHDIVGLHFAAHFETIAGMQPVYDYKSLLQELIQNRHHQMPQYEIIGESGPDHDKTFQVALTINDFRTEGVGKSKKSAEQDAAKNALEQLQ
ncbi:MAG: ribonuclease III [Thermodesulfobacteriota bacterium]